MNEDATWAQIAVLLSITGSGLCAGFFLVTLYHAFSYRATHSRNEARTKLVGIDVRIMITAATWFLVATIFGLWTVLSSTAIASGDSPPRVAGTTLLFGTILSFLNLELFLALYLPGAGLGVRVTRVFVQRFGKGAPADWRVGMIAFSSGFMSLLTVRMDKLNQSGTPSVQNVDAWFALLSLVLLLSLAVGAVAFFATGPIYEVLVSLLKYTLNMLNLGIVFVLWLAARAIQAAPLPMGYVPKSVAQGALDELDLPKGYRTDTVQDELGKNRRSMMRRSWLWWLATMFASVFFIGLPLIERLVSSTATARVQLSFLGAAIVPLALLVMFQFHRRAVELWQNVGLLNASLVSQEFARYSGHYLKNQLPPIDTALKTMEDVLDFQKAVDEETKSLVARGRGHLAPAKKNMDMLYEWIETTRQSTQEMSRNSLALFSARSSKPYPAEEVLQELKTTCVTHAHFFRNRFPTHRPLQFRVKVRIGPGDVCEYEFSVDETTEDLATPVPYDTTEEQDRRLRAELSRFQIVYDHKILYDAVINLLRNAIEALAKGGGSDPDNPRVTVSFRLWPGHPHPITISVRDNGPGIPPNRREYLFDPHVSIGTKEDSTGVGLFMANQSMLAMNGRLLLTSGTGTATRVSFTSIALQLPADALTEALT